MVCKARGDRRRTWIALAALAIAGCDAKDSDAAVAGSASAGIDSDGSSDSAGESGEGSGDGGFGTDGDVPPPEEEEEADFRVPQASGRFVYSASELTDQVAVIDSSNLSVSVIGVGRGPTVVASLVATPDTGAVAVLDQGSDDVALVSTDAGGNSVVEIIDTTPGANNLAVSPDGRYVIVHVDIDGPEEIGAGSDQEVTVIDVPQRAAYPMTVGARPSEVAFSSDSARAYIVTDDGVNVVELAMAAMIGKPDVIPVYTDAGIDPSIVEVHVAADLGVALARVEGRRDVVATDLVTRAQQVIEFDAIPTDLDIAADGSFALFTVPRAAGSQLVELPLPLGAGAVRTEIVSQEYVGLAQLSPTGDVMLLYTSQNPFTGGGGGEDPPDDPTGPPATTGDTDTDTDTDGPVDPTTGGEPENPDAVPSDRDPRLRVTIARRDGQGWGSFATLFVQRPVRSAGVAPDGANGMLLHEVTEDPIPHAYTLLDLEKEFPVKKLQTVEAVPEPILFTPDGGRAVVLLGSSGERRVDQIDLRTFIVDALELGSPPQGAGYVATTEKIFVSQDHPTGRITFIEADGGIETVTGFRLGDAVKD